MSKVVVGKSNYLQPFIFVEGEKLDGKMKKLETQYNSLQVLSIITKLGTKEVLNYYVMLVKK